MNLLFASLGLLTTSFSFAAAPPTLVPLGLLADLPTLADLEELEAEEDELEGVDPTLLERAAACAGGNGEDLAFDCDLPAAPATVAWHPGTGRVAMLWSDVVGGGTDCADVEGLILRASDGHQVASRVLADAEACEEDWESAQDGRATWRWLAFLHERGYVSAESAMSDFVGPWGEEPGAAAMLEGAMKGWVVYVEPTEDEVGVLLVAPGNLGGFELGREPIEEVPCWEDDPEADDCSLRYPFLADVAVSPDGRFLTVAYGMTGLNCRSDSEYTWHIAPLPGPVVRAR